MSDNSYMKQVWIFLSFFLIMISLPVRTSAQEKEHPKEPERILDTIQADRSIQNQQTLEVLQQVNEETAQRAEEAREAQKRADAVARESEKALKMEKRAQRARKRANKQAEKAINAQDNY